MSASPEFGPEIGLLAAPKYRQPSSPPLPEIEPRPIVTLLSVEDHGGTRSLPEKEEEQDKDGDEVCRTPTSEESKIPEILRCPPAPRKLMRMEVSYKRRRSQLQLLRVGPEVIELLFHGRELSSVDGGPPPASPVTKKSKRSCPNDE